ncbi:hypothetical protein [Haloferax sp. Q22]|uniref:hypothetical protein n=1 Tax=Haloferax sp. (strain Q22) TaxID=1526048 RepID=UPI000A4264B0|nr:hypothetical protein [Haloferax sp. Q22]
MKTISDDASNVELPKNEKILLIQGISGVFHTPEIVEGKTSSTGKTIKVEHKHKDKTYQLDTEQILTGGLEVRRATTFQLYTPEKYHRKQKSNKNPGPRSGVNKVKEKSELPEPTHEPVEG